MERNTLMEWVYPKIKEYCREKHGLEFQVPYARCHKLCLPFYQLFVYLFISCLFSFLSAVCLLFQSKVVDMRLGVCDEMTNKHMTTCYFTLHQLFVYFFISWLFVYFFISCLFSFLSAISLLFQSKVVDMREGVCDEMTNEHMTTCLLTLHQLFVYFFISFLFTFFIS